MSIDWIKIVDWDQDIDVSTGFVTECSEQLQSLGDRRPNVRYVDVEFKPENATVGYARKVLTDAVLARSLARPNQQEPSEADPFVTS
jgi:hypothetical protein